jgi:hypothetical protein
VETVVAAYLGFKTVKPILDGVNLGIDTLANRADAAAAEKGGIGRLKAAGQGLLGVLGSPWTIGLSLAAGAVIEFEQSANRGSDAVQRFREQAEQAADDQENLKKALQTSNGNLDTGVIDAQTSSIKNLRDAAAANAKDIPGFSDTTVAAFADVGNDLFGVGSGVVSDYTTRDSVDRSSKAITDAFNQVGLSNEQLAQKVTGSKPAFDDLITKLQGMGDGGKDAAAKLQALRDEWAVDAASVNPVTAAIQDLGNKQKDATNAIEAATNALERQRQGGLTVESAQEKVNETLTQLGTSAQAAGGAVIDASGKIDTTTASGQQLYSLINGNLAPAWESLTSAVYRDAIQHGQTADAAEQAAQKASDSLKTSAQQQIEAMGYTQTQADTLLQHYQPLAGNFKATFTADTDPAMTAIQQYEKYLDSVKQKGGDIPGVLQYYSYALGLGPQYSPGFGTPVTPPSTPGVPSNVAPFFPGRADGGPVYGPGTESSDSILMRLSTGEYVVNAEAVKKYGLPLLDSINNESFQQVSAESVAPPQAAPSAVPSTASSTPGVPASSPAAPTTVTYPQAPLPAPQTDQQIQSLQDRSAVDAANSERNGVYANPASTSQDKQAADYKYLQSQNAYQKDQQQGGLPQKYTLPGIASSAAGILAQGLLDSVGLGSSILSDSSYYANDVNLIGQRLSGGSTPGLGGYAYTPQNLPSVQTPDYTSTIGGANAATVTPSSYPGTSATPGTSYSPSGGAEQWRSLAASMLVKEGFPATQDNVNTMLAQVDSESGGDPTAVNNWDSNAAAGHPSRGLLQTIPSTFETWRDPSLPDNINDPAANMAAALRYYRATYGSDLSTQWGHGHGYADGGLVTGQGGPKSDNIMAWLSGGEYVVNAHASQRNLPLLEAINSSQWNPVALNSGTLTGPAAQQAPGPVRDHSVNIGSVHAMDNDGLVRSLDRFQEQQMMGALAAYS